MSGERHLPTPHFQLYNFQLLPLSRITFTIWITRVGRKARPRIDSSWLLSKAATENSLLKTGTTITRASSTTPAKSNVSCRRAKNLVEGNLAEESDFPELLCPFFTDKIESGFYDGKNIIQNMQGDFRRILRNDAMAGPC